ESSHPCGTARLEECALRLHDWDQRRHDIEDAQAKLFKGVGNRTEMVSPMTQTNLQGQRLPARIEPGADSVSLGTDRGGQTVGEMCHPGDLPSSPHHGTEAGVLFAGTSPSAWYQSSVRRTPSTQPTRGT